MESQPVFRAAKRRKFVRTKVDEDEDDGDLNLSEHPKATDPSTSEQNDQNQTKSEEPIPTSTSSNVIKAHRSNKPRIGGVHFSNARTSSKEDESSELTKLETVQSADEKFKSMNDRFVGSTGQVVNVDKHMMAYIDSEIAKRRLETTSQWPDHSISKPKESSDNDQYSSTSESDTAPQPQHSASHHSTHQLSEVDLGPHSSLSNASRTHNLLSQLISGQPISSSTIEHKPRRPRKPRLGRDGKPLRARPRKRRPSEDIARDKLVEDVLREHAIEHYEAPTATKAGTGVGDGSTDEQFAEAFRARFMDALAERQALQKMKSAGTGASSVQQSSGVGVNAGSGPKLGGSRSARAKMAAMQASQQQGQGQGQGQGK